MVAIDRSPFPVDRRTDAIDRHMHSRASPRYLAASGDVPATTDRPELFYVKGPPEEMWLVTPDGKRVLGFSAHAEATSTLTLSLVFQDIPGTSITLPKPGVYTIVATFDMRSVSPISGFIIQGILATTAGVAVDAPREALFYVGGDNERATVGQTWRVTTTTDDEAFILRGNRTSGTGSGTIESAHTTIAAFSFMGGGSTAASHQHPHSETTGQTEDSHHPADEIANDAGNTKVEVEQSVGENVVRITAGGIQVARVDSTELEIARFLSVGSFEPVTISGGTITISRSHVAISPEGGVADSIDNIVGGSTGRQVFLFNAHSVVSLTLNHLTGSAGSIIFFPDGKNVVLTPSTGIWMVSEASAWVPAAPAYHSAYTDADAQAAVPLEIWMNLGDERGGHTAIG